MVDVTLRNFYFENFFVYLLCVRFFTCVVRQGGSTEGLTIILLTTLS